MFLQRFLDRVHQGIGVIAEDKEQGLVSIAEPVGVICGVTPTTNPTSTTIFKALVALLEEYFCGVLCIS